MQLKSIILSRDSILTLKSISQLHISIDSKVLVYITLKIIILSRDPLHDAKGAYVLIFSEESHRAVVVGSGTGPSQRAQSSVFNSSVNNMSPFPSSSSSSGLSDEQISKLFSLIKDNSLNDKGKGVQANMAGANQHLTYTNKNLVNVVDIFYLRIRVSHLNITKALITKVGNLKLTNFSTLYDVLVVPEYFVTLVSAHKVARDNKFIVGFGESKCFLMSRDLMDVKLMRIGKQVNGLCYFNSQEDAYDKAITEAIRETKSEKKQALALEDQEQDQPTHAELTESDSESSKLETEDVSEASAEESDESDEDNKENMNYISKRGKMKTRGEQRREKKVTLETTESEQEDETESEQEDGESNSESSKFETNYVSDTEKSGEESDENDDENEECSDNSSKENSFVDKARESKKFTEKDDRSIQQIRNFGTKKRLRQRPNRNTALESAIAPDSEDEMSSEKSSLSLETVQTLICCQDWVRSVDVAVNLKENIDDLKKFEDEKTLKRYCMENSKRISIPMQEKLKLSKSQGASTAAEMKRVQNVPYALTVGSIMYVVRCTRPDVAFAQNITSRFQQNLGDLKRELRVSCYTDAGYLTDADDLKSQTGYVFVLNGGAVDWKSAKQSIFATSSVYCCFRCFQGSGAIAIANESGITKGARHFRAKVHYLREVIEFGDIKLEKVHTYDNLADPFTKALAFPKHSENTKNIGMLPASSL
nr:ribonuclease H-like domain-containing protein [Tanacetum cinerariifolium]